MNPLEEWISHDLGLGMNANKAYWMILILFITTVVGAGGCAAPEATFEEVLHEGIKERQAGHFPEALAMLKMASEKDPERPEPAYEQGVCYLAMADHQFVENDLPGALRYCDLAIAAFDRAIGAFPGYSRAVQGKADALKLKGKHAAAFAIARWVTAQSGYQAKKLILEARQYLDAGDLDNAQLAFKQATAVEPNNAKAHAELGLFYMRLKNNVEAIKSLRRAYKLDPGAPGVFSALVELGSPPRYPRDR